MEELIAFGATIVDIFSLCKRYKKGNITISAFDNFMIELIKKLYHCIKFKTNCEFRSCVCVPR